MSSLRPAREVPGRGWSPGARRLHPTGWGPPSGNRQWVLIGAASLVLVAVVAVTFGLVASRATGRQRVANPTVVEEGGCVRAVPPSDRWEPASCDDAAAVGRVIGVLPGGFPGRLCPDATDLAGIGQFAQTICVRYRRGSHPGDTGQGGGVLRAGDCVVDVDQVGLEPVPEVACTDPKAAYQVAAKAIHKARCPDGTSRLLEIPQTPRPKACLTRLEVVDDWPR